MYTKWSYITCNESLRWHSVAQMTIRYVSVVDSWHHTNCSQNWHNMSSGYWVLISDATQFISLLKVTQHDPHPSRRHDIHKWLVLATVRVSIADKTQDDLNQHLTGDTTRFKLYPYLTDNTAERVSIAYENTTRSVLSINVWQATPLTVSLVDWWHSTTCIPGWQNTTRSV